MNLYTNKSQNEWDRKEISKNRKKNLTETTTKTLTIMIPFFVLTFNNRAKSPKFIYENSVSTSMINRKMNNNETIFFTFIN